jgi:hypothetical protein
MLNSRTIVLEQIDEEQGTARTSVASREHRDDQPPKDLKEVVRDRDKVEAISLGDGAFAASCRSEITELNMSDEIRDFGKLRAGRRSVGVVTDENSKARTSHIAAPA